jgi:deoxyribonuclease V
MLACVDVHYHPDLMATVALVFFEDWSSPTPIDAAIHTMPCDADYEPGNFYKLELPCILSVLEKQTGVLPGLIIIDGYVWLTDDDGKPKPGLGAHLFKALGETVSVIGVAKSRFKDAPAVEILRGTSAQPLFITAAGIEVGEAAQLIKDMHGDHRLPTLIKLADQLARGGRPT